MGAMTSPPGCGKRGVRGGGNTPLNPHASFPFPLTPVNLLGCTLPFAYIGPTVRSGGLGGIGIPPAPPGAPYKPTIRKNPTPYCPWKTGKVEKFPINPYPTTNYTFPPTGKV